jgi:hypothetical protein
MAVQVRDGSFGFFITEVAAIVAQGRDLSIQLFLLLCPDSLVSLRGLRRDPETRKSVDLLLGIVACRGCLAERRGIRKAGYLLDLGER